MRKKISNFRFEKFAFFVFFVALALISAKSASAQIIMSDSSNILEIKASSTPTKSIFKFLPSTSANSFSLQAIAETANPATTISVFEYLSSNSLFKMLNGVLNFNPSNNRIGIGMTDPQQKFSVGSASSDYIQSYGGFIGNPSANIGGTGDAAYFPEGIYSAKMNWLYGGVAMNNGSLSNVGSANFSGNVGIGTASPQATLDVNGLIKMRASNITTTSDVINKGYLDSALEALSSDFSASTTAANYWLANGANIYNKNAGNVGIGTANPGAKLQLSGTADNAMIIDERDWSSKAMVFFREGGSTDYGGYVGYNALADGLQFNTLENSVEKLGMFIARGTGNVGIGTTTPSQKLHVDGSIRTSGDIIVDGNYGTGLVGLYSATRYQNVFSMGAAYRLAANGTTPNTMYGIAWTHSNIGGQSKAGLAHQALFMTNGVTQTAIGTGIWTLGGYTQTGSSLNTFSGNVGVGVSPTQKLHVAGGNIFITDASINSGTPHAAITKTYLDSALETYGSKWILNGSKLYASSTAWNVGIGTNNPSYKLQVDGVLGVKETSGTNGTRAIIFADDDGAYYTMDGNSAKPIIFRTWTSGAETMRINTNGNVGIGTDAPGAFRLFVNGAIYSTGLNIGGDLTITGGDVSISNNNGGINFNDASAYWLKTATNYGIYWDTTANQFKFNGAGVTKASIDLDDGAAYFNGSVGIGTTAPSAKLTVSGGNIFITDAVIGSSTPHAAVTKTYLDSAIQALASTTSYWTANGTHIFNTNTGNVGVGTSNPGQQLEITKNFRLPATVGTSAYGVIYKGISSFIHDFNYGLNGNGITTNGGNTFVGLNAGNFTMGSTATSFSQSSSNTGVGYASLFANTTGYSNSALGYQSLLSNTTGHSNSALGYLSLSRNTTGYGNSALGYLSLENNTTGGNNSALGYNSLRSNTTGGGNSAFGYDSLVANSTGFFNSAFGDEAGKLLATGGVRTTGDLGLYLGYSSKASADGTNNEIVIGALAVGNGSNTVTLGNNSIFKTILKGNVGIGTTTPEVALDVNGLIKMRASNITTTSDVINKGYLDSALLAYGSSNNFWKLNGSNLYPSSTAWNVGIGTASPGVKLDVVGGPIRTNNQLISTVANGVAPLVVTSATLVSNLNADLLDNQQGTYYDQRVYNSAANYFGGGYNPGGSEKPNWAGFGAGKLKLQMLSGSNIGAPGMWNDVLWMSSYTGGDVKGSNALIFSKYSDRVGFVRQDYDSAVWGTYREFYHTGNSNLSTVDWWAKNFYANGSVGIGTTAPSAKLHVAGDASFFNDTSPSQIHGVAAPTALTDAVNRSYVDSNFIASTSLPTIINTNAFVQGGNSFGVKAILGTNDNQALGIETNGTEKMTILANGNVGIGVNTPLAKLQINNEAAFNTLTPGPAAYYGLHFGGQTTADYATGITWSGGTSGTQAGIYVQGSGSYGSKMYFATTNSYATGAQNRMIISESGNVGIGTTAPGAYKLYVNGAAYASGNLNVGGDATVSGGDVYDNSGDLHLSGEDNLYLKIDYNNDDANTRNIIFAKNTALETAPTGVNELMRITETGNVGIGLGGAAPTQKLYVKGDASFGNSVIHDVSAPVTSTDAVNRFYVDSNFAPITSQTWKLNGSNLYASSTTWNVGIGTTNPGVALDVVGKVAASAGVWSPGATGFYSTTYVSGARNPIWRFGNADTYGLSYFQGSSGVGAVDTFGVHLGTATAAGSNLKVTPTMTSIANKLGIDTITPNAKLDVANGSIVNTTATSNHYRNVYSSYLGANTVVGTLKISLPRMQPSTMIDITIKGYEYRTNFGAWEVRVSGYVYGSDGWYSQNHKAQIIGSAPFDSVRLGTDGSKPVILLGNTGTKWTYGNIEVSDVTTSYNNISDWGSGWASAVLTNETGITVSATPLISTYVLPNGNFGIGTTAPSSKLHVVGSSYLNGTIKTALTGTGSRCLHVDSNGVIGTMAGDCGTSTGGDNLGNHTATENIKLGNHWLSGDGGLEGIFVKSNGDVTIGNINGLYGNSSLNFSIDGGSGASIDSMGQMVLEGVGPVDIPTPLTLNLSGGSITAGGTIYNTNASYWLRFDNTLTDSLRVQGDLNTTGILKSSGTGANYMMGRLGLGTTNPATTARVTIDTPVASSSILFRAAGADKAILSFKNGIILTNYGSMLGAPVPSINTGLYNIGIGSYAIYSGAGYSNIAIGNNAAQAAVSSGNIAIGETALYSTGSSGGNNIAIGNGALYSGAVQKNIAIGYGALNTAGVGNYNIAIGNRGAAGSNKLYIGDLNGGISPYTPLIYGDMTSITTGAVGIKTTNLQSGMAMTVAGKIYADDFIYSSSDERLKHDIKNLGNLDYQKILKLRPVSFTYNKNNSKGFGFIAQELEKIYPEMVETNQSDGMKSVTYDNLISPTIMAIQEQQKKIEEQETLIHILLDRVNKLENSTK